MTFLNSAKQRLALAGFILIELHVITTIAILLAALLKPAAETPPADSSSQEQFDFQYQLSHFWNGRFVGLLNKM